MRKVILCLAVSFDGFIEGPNGEIDWIVFDKDGGSDLMSFVDEIDTVFYGRVSYELWGNPPITDASSDFERSFYGALKKMDRYVFSTTKTELEGNPTVVSSRIEKLVRDLKQKPGKHIWLYGGSDLIRTFMNHDLVDEYRIAIMPSIIGEGKPLFSGIVSQHKLRLIEATPSNSGVLAVKYEAKR